VPRADAAKYASAFDAVTSRNVAVERAFQLALGGGCHTAFGAHATGDMVYFFHEQVGVHRRPLSGGDFADPTGTARRILQRLGLLP